MEIRSGSGWRQCISVPIVNNILPENQRQFQLTVSSASHSVSVAPAIVTILDDGIRMTSVFYQFMQ